jgi:hypothetical protein
VVRVRPAFKLQTQLIEGRARIAALFLLAYAQW